jgi:hypothetical protein
MESPLEEFMDKTKIPLSPKEILASLTGHHAHPPELAEFVAPPTDSQQVEGSEMDVAESIRPEAQMVVLPPAGVVQTDLAPPPVPEFADPNDGPGLDWSVEEVDYEYEFYGGMSSY